MTTTKYLRDWNSKLLRNACNYDNLQEVLPQKTSIFKKPTAESRHYSKCLLLSTNDNISIILSLYLFFRIYWILVLPLHVTLTFIRMSFPVMYSCSRLLTVVSACLSFPLDEPLNHCTSFFLYGATAPNEPRPPHFRGFTITPRHITLGRTPLDEWPAQRRDLHLTTHNTHKRQTSMPRWDSNP
jgi:hypothetical protein